MFGYWTDTIRLYRRERFPLRVFAPVATVLTFAAFAKDAPDDLPQLLLSLAASMLLLFQFRVWDDLGDRDHDIVHHPGRVLSRCRRASWFYALVAVIGLVNCLIFFRLGHSPIPFLLICGGALLWYTRVSAVSRSSLTGRHMLLLKYPAFVWLIAPSHPLQLISSMAIVYACCVIYEALHDRTTTAPVIPVPEHSIFESVRCYSCGSASSRDFIVAQDDLTGKPGNFRFVTCVDCGLVYQNPRIRMGHIKSYYDNEYIAHRKKTDWGRLTWFYNRVMDRHDVDKDRIVRRYVQLSPESAVLDVGCAAGTFLQKMRTLYGARVSGVDFKDLSGSPSMKEIEFHCGLFYEQPLAAEQFDLVTMWHFLEHDYDPPRTLATAKNVLKAGGWLAIEVPRLDSVTFQLYRERWPGLQAPQHTVLFAKATLLRVVEQSGLEVVDYLPYGAFPPYFYIFAGAAFKILKGRGLNLSKAIVPYFIGQLILFPLLLAERRLNLAMQTVICRRKS